MLKPVRLLARLAPVVAASCAAIAPPPPTDAVPLADLEEPAEWRLPPDDEAARRDLDLGSYTGIHVADVPDSLAELVGNGDGIQVERVTENSPAVAAGIEPGDVLLEAAIGTDGTPVTLDFPSQWRRLELDCPVDGVLTVLLDRGGLEHEVEIHVTARLGAVERMPSERLREEARAGIVIRTATEVEADRAGLGPGAGAVLVGLARSSPWRAAGMRFGDLIVAVDEQEVAHPTVLLEAIRTADTDTESLRLVLVRDGTRAWLDAPLTRRESETTSFWLPPLYSYEKDRNRRSHSFLLGMFRHQSTAVAWDFRMFWLFRFAGGDADVLRELDS